METYRQETVSHALRDLADRILRDSVDSDRLEAYVRQLLETHLVELHTACRREVPLLAHCVVKLGPQELATILRETANDFDD